VRAIHSGRRRRAVALLLAAALVAAAGVASGVASPRIQLPDTVEGGQPPVVLTPRDPFKLASMRRLLAGRAGNITAGVFDVNSGATWIYHRDDREQTASIVKVDILATLLAKRQAEDEHLSPGEESVATGMIEASDNDDATTLWDDEGGPAAVAAFDARLQMTQTTPNGAWGLTETDPRDQLRLLEHIALPNRILHAAARDYELYLMRHVISADYWGITAGPRPGVSVAVKNGWLPVPGGWQINSIGAIHGEHRHYLIAVMTNGNADEGYGIDTIEAISRIVWDDMRRRTAPPSGASGPSGVSGATGASGAS
jgi:Beta-lactamase enzyme family